MIEKKRHTDVTKRAHSAIVLSLGDEVLREVTEENSVKAVWDKLEDLRVHLLLLPRHLLHQLLFLQHQFPLLLVPPLRLDRVRGHSETNYGHSVPFVNQEERIRQYQDDVGSSVLIIFKNFAGFSLSSSGNI